MCKRLSVTVIPNAHTTGSTTQLETFDLPDVAGQRDVRVVGHGATLNAGGTSTWNSVTEVEVYALFAMASNAPASPPIQTASVAPSTPSSGQRACSLWAGLLAMLGVGVGISLQSGGRRRVSTPTRMLIALLVLFLLPVVSAAQNVEYYHLDALGSVRAVTDASGAIIEQHDYLPFGEECTTGPCASNVGLGSGQPRRFSGKERDGETNFVYFSARYYLGSTARFTTQDPVVNVQDNLANPQQWNRYSYAHNCPLRYSDPDGREAEQAVKGAVIHIGVVAAHEGNVRARYNALKLEIARLPAGERSAAREALKHAMREESTPFGRLLAERAGQSAARRTRLAEKSFAELAQSASSTNPWWNNAGAISKWGGRTVLAGAAAVSIYEISTAPEGQRSRVIPPP